MKLLPLQLKTKNFYSELHTFANNKSNVYL